MNCRLVSETSSSLLAPCHHSQKIIWSFQEDLFLEWHALEQSWPHCPSLFAQSSCILIDVIFFCIYLSYFPQGDLSELGKVLMQGSFSVWTGHRKGPTKMKDLARFKPMQRHLFLYEKALVFCKKREDHGDGYDKTSSYSFKHFLKVRIFSLGPLPWEFWTVNFVNPEYIFSSAVAWILLSRTIMLQMGVPRKAGGCSNM